VEIYEIRGPDMLVDKVDFADAGNIQTQLRPRREIESKLNAAADAIAQIREMSPDSAHAIEMRLIAGKDELAFCFRGLTFARRTSTGVFFGLDNAVNCLTAANKPRLARLLHQLDLKGNSLSEDANHFLYHAAPERWLETIVLADPSKLDALDPKYFYSQVPAVAAGDRGVLDLLGITHRGRLVIIRIEGFGRYSNADTGGGLLAARPAASERRRFSRVWLFSRRRNRSRAAACVIGGAGSAFSLRDGYFAEIFIAGNSSDAQWTFGELAHRAEFIFRQ
jgi:hypothetical protein